MYPEVVLCCAKRCVSSAPAAPHIQKISKGSGFSEIVFCFVLLAQSERQYKSPTFWQTWMTCFYNRTRQRNSENGEGGVRGGGGEWNGGWGGGYGSEWVNKNVVIGIINSWGRGPHLSSDYQMISIPHFRSVIVEVMLLARLPPEEPFHAEQKAKQQMVSANYFQNLG